MSAPVKRESDKCIHRTVSLDKETDDYAKAYLIPFSPWIRDRIRDHMSGNTVYLESRDATYALEKQAEAQDALASFKEKYGCSPEVAKENIVQAQARIETLGKEQEAARENERYSEVWEHIKDRSTHQAVSWLQSRGKEMGFLGSPLDSYKDIRKWAEEHGLAGGDSP